MPNTGLLITRGKIAIPGAIRPDDLFAGLSCSFVMTRPELPSKSGALSAGDKKKKPGTGSCQQECIEIDADGLYISPGFIDVHVHGGNGYDIMDGTATAIREIAAFHAKGGTTSFLATVAPAPAEKLKKALSVINAHTMRNSAGAHLLGAHMEGPYLNPSRAGAIGPDHLRPADLKEMESFVSLCEGSLKMVTLAPELPGCREIIKMLAREDIIVSAGHSEATYETAMSSFFAGVKHATHIFNASAPLHHREPGLVGAVLAHKDITAEVIADGLHLHPSMLKLLYSVKGRKGLTLATDSVRAAGMPDGKYTFCDREIILKGGKVTLAGGSLAGSSLTMIEAVKNMVTMAGIPLYEAIMMASLNPARMLGRESIKGTLAPGMDADLLLLDSDLNVRLTMVGGEIVYDCRN
ncbi:MAG: N-acetylglucosamine-6-phosphate deacetylase [Bacillota bacterium]